MSYLLISTEDYTLIPGHSLFALQFAPGLFLNTRQFDGSPGLRLVSHRDQKTEATVYAFKLFTLAKEEHKLETQSMSFQLMKDESLPPEINIALTKYAPFGSVLWDDKKGNERWTWGKVKHFQKQLFQINLNLSILNTVPPPPWDHIDVHFPYLALQTLSPEILWRLF